MTAITPPTIDHKMQQAGLGTGHRQQPTSPHSPHRGQKTFLSGGAPGPPWPSSHQLPPPPACRLRVVHSLSRRRPGDLRHGRSHTVSTLRHLLSYLHTVTQPTYQPSPTTLTPQSVQSHTQSRRELIKCPHVVTQLSPPVISFEV